MTLSEWYASEGRYFIGKYKNRKTSMYIAEQLYSTALEENNIRVSLKIFMYKMTERLEKDLFLGEKNEITR